MTGNFIENIDLLLAQTPKRYVRGVVEVDQIYAHYQHAHPEFHHPDGGQAFYLRDPLFGKIRQYMDKVGREMLSGHGVDFLAGMRDAMEDLSQEVYERAPFEFGDLKASGHPMVEIDGELRYDRPPLVGRLDAKELSIKSHLRYLFDPHRYDYDKVV